MWYIRIAPDVSVKEAKIKLSLKIVEYLFHFKRSNNNCKEMQKYQYLNEISILFRANKTTAAKNLAKDLGFNVI